MQQTSVQKPEGGSNELVAELSRPHVIEMSEYVPEKLLEGQLQKLGVTERELLNAETSRGQKIDPRIDETLMRNVHKIFQGAQGRFREEIMNRSLHTEERLRIFMGPTSRSVDHRIDGDAVHLMVQRLIDEGHLEELREAVQNGPGDEAKVWKPPKSPTELVASILRWGTLTVDDKTRIRVNGELREWMFATLSSKDYDTKPCLGGITAVATDLCYTLQHEPTMMALGRIPPGVRERLPATTKVLGSDPHATRLAHLPKEKAFSGNFSLGIEAGALSLPVEYGELVVDKEVRQLEDLAKFDILVTGASSIQGFATVTKAQMRSIGAEHDLMMLTGTKNLGTAGKIEDYLSKIEAAHAEGMCVALCYSETKFPTWEVEFWKEQKEKRCIDLLDINSLEVCGVLERIERSINRGNPLELDDDTKQRLRQTLARAQTESEVWGDGHETPEWVSSSALILQEILELPVVRVRGMVSDIIVTAAGMEFDREQTRDHQAMSRIMGTMKVAHPEALISHSDEIGHLKNIPAGRYVGALVQQGDHIEQSDRNRSNGRSALVGELISDLYTTLSDGRTVLAGVPIPMYSREGGTQSAGDYMATVFCTSEQGNLLRAAWEYQQR